MCFSIILVISILLLVYFYVKLPKSSFMLRQIVQFYVSISFWTLFSPKMDGFIKTPTDQFILIVFCIGVVPLLLFMNRHSRNYKILGFSFKCFAVYFLLTIGLNAEVNITSLFNNIFSFSLAIIITKLYEKELS